MNPKEVFDNPDVKLLTSGDLESQHFERKRQITADKLADAISGFSNKNKDGGLIIVGIEDDGAISGISSLGQQWYNNIQTDLNRLIHDRVYEFKNLACTNKEGSSDFLLLIYVKYSEGKVIEKANRKAYVRIGDQTHELDEEEKIELKYSKGQLEFESVCYEDFDIKKLDDDMLDQFIDGIKKREGITSDLDAEQALISKRLIKDEDGIKKLTSAGLLTLSKDPKEFISGAKIRFLRYEGKSEGAGRSLNVIKDKEFEGPIPRLIEKSFEYIKTQIKEFSNLDENGKFVKEPEYPPTVILEAIVNAVVHRSYSLKNAHIFIKMFDDRLVIESPGRFPGMVTPTNFYHHPRNPKIMDALKYFEYVKAMAEGTRRMKEDMLQSNLPAPEFKETDSSIMVILKNNLEERSRAPEESKEDVPQYSNLFNLAISDKGGSLLKPSFFDYDFLKLIRRTFISKLIDTGWFVPNFKTNAYQLNNPIYEVKQGDKIIISILPGFRFSIRKLSDELFLIIDPRVLLKPRVTLEYISSHIDLNKELIGMDAFDKESKTSGKIISISDGEVILKTNKEVLKANHRNIYPNMKTHHLQRLINALGISYDIDAESKKYSLLTVVGAPKIRAKRTKELAELIGSSVFPLKIDDHNINLDINPVKLKKPTFELKKDIKEVQISVDTLNRYKGDIVLDTLTTHGAYEKPEKEIRIIPVCTKDVSEKMEYLISQISKGSFRYQGVEKTFGVKLIKENTLECNDSKEYVDKLKEKIKEIKDNSQYIFLIYCSESEYSRFEYDSPYYACKRYLLEEGYNSQMVDTSTLNNLRFKDLNISLDLFAKSGFTPWVLSEGFPDCDLLIGLSYSNISDKDGQSRILGYVNVFDKMGRWRFYKGTTELLSFEDRKQHFTNLIKETLEELKDERNIKKIQIHHSCRLSREIKEKIYSELLTEFPDIELIFVWINSETPIRMYDESFYSDGSLPRGNYVITSPNQFYLSTTGCNTLRQKGMGTPKLLEVNIDCFPNNLIIEHKLIALQLLSLTKLNWASTKTFCHLPITLKYANDIAYLMNAIFKGFGEFKLNQKLKSNPWFL